MDHISLASMKLSRFPNIINLAPEVTCLTDLNISRNNLFNGDEVFEVSKCFDQLYLVLVYGRCFQALSLLTHLQKLNISENFINGMLSAHAGNLINLEELRMDVNNLTSLCPEVRNWTRLRIITLSDNSLTCKSD
jgi:Leucine-rich repeat (LRR) protein